MSRKREKVNKKEIERKKDTKASKYSDRGGGRKRRRKEVRENERMKREGNKGKAEQ